MYMASDVLNQRSFVSTFFSKEKKKASTHSYLKTKMNRQRHPPDDMPWHRPPSVISFLHTALGLGCKHQKQLTGH